MVRIIVVSFFLCFIYSIPSFPQVQYKTYLGNASITSIDGDGNYLWVATYGYGIFMYSFKGDKWINFSTKNGRLSNDLFYCIAVSKYYVWAGSGEGLFIFDKRRDRWTKKKFGLGGEMGNWIRSLCYDKSQNVLWIGRFEFLTRLNVRTLKYKDYNLTEKKDAKTNTFTSIRLDGDSLVWFGTESGVHIYDKSKSPDDKSAWSFINNKNKGFDEDGDAVSIHDILFEQKYVWFGTDEFITPQKPQFNIGGIYRFNRKYRWDRISKQNGLPGNGVNCLARTGNQIWTGIYSFDRNEKKEYGKGLALINRLTGRVFTINLDLIKATTSTINTLYFDGNDMWIGTDDGLWRVVISNPLAEWTLKKERKYKRKRR